MDSDGFPFMNLTDVIGASNVGNNAAHIHDSRGKRVIISESAQKISNQSKLAFLGEKSEVI